jgi:hypothetical protein
MVVDLKNADRHSALILRAFNGTRLKKKKVVYSNVTIEGHVRLSKQSKMSGVFYLVIVNVKILCTEKYHVFNHQRVTAPLYINRIILEARDQLVQ